MKITKAFLLMPPVACADQVALFEATFPDGAEITRENIETALRANLDLDWLLGRRFPSFYADYRVKRDARRDDFLAQKQTLDTDHRAKMTAIDADYRAGRSVIDADDEAKLDDLVVDYGAKMDALAADYVEKRDRLSTDFLAQVHALLREAYLMMNQSGKGES